MIRYMQEGSIYEVDAVELAKWCAGWMTGLTKWQDRPGKEVEFYVHFDGNISDYDDWEYFLEQLAYYDDENKEEILLILDNLKNE